MRSNFTLDTDSKRERERNRDCELSYSMLQLHHLRTFIQVGGICRTVKRHIWMLNNYSIEQVKSFKSPGIVFSCEMPREYVAQKPRELLQHCNHPKLKGPYLSLLHANRTQPKLELSCYSESSLPIQLFLSFRTCSDKISQVCTPSSLLYLKHDTSF